jgi:ATP-dependent Clp protease protease subunit
MIFSLKKSLILTGIGAVLLFSGSVTNLFAKELKKVPSDVQILSKNNMLKLSGEIDGETVGQLIAKAREIDATLGKNEEITLFVNSPGGEISAGEQLDEALKGLKHKVKTVTMFAASMAFDLVQSQGDRLILSTGTLMSHRARGQVSGEYGGVRGSSQMEKRLAYISSMVDELDNKTVARTNGKQTLASYQTAYENELWVSGQQAVDGGYADRVIKLQCDDTLSGTTVQHGFAMGIIPVTYELDNCPINTSPMNIKVEIETTEGRMNSIEFLNKGGSFGSGCYVANTVNKLCALDQTLTVDKINEYKNRFKEEFVADQHRVIYKTIRVK